MTRLQRRAVKQMRDMAQQARFLFCKGMQKQLSEGLPIMERAQEILMECQSIGEDIIADDQDV